MPDDLPTGVESRVMDPLVILGLSYAGKEAVAVVGQFVREVFGPSARATGEGIAAPLKQWAERRNDRAEKLVIDAALVLDDAGLTPHAVPGEILIPLLQAGSATEQPELQDKWVALLANAASGLHDGIIPGFIDILRQLTPTQAKILDWMFGQKYPVSINSWPDFDRKDIEQVFSLSPAQYGLLITDMERLKLIEAHRKVTSSKHMIDGEELLQWVMDQLNERERYKSLALTSLGVHFMEACTRPNAHST